MKEINKKQREFKNIRCSETLCVLCFLWLIMFVSSCERNIGREITDRSGQTVTINNKIERVVSTAPSNTEIIIDLGLAHKLVAIDKHSANIEGVPLELVILDFFYPDAEVLVSLKPDLIIASGHNATGTGEDPFRLLREMGIPVVYISMSRSIDDIYKDIAFIADILQAEKEGENLIFEMNMKIQGIVRQTTGHIMSLDRAPAVYFEISAAPDMMTFGKDSFINDMIFIIGGQNIFENDGWLVTPGAETIIQRNPDIIFTSVNYIEDPIAEIKARPGFNHINAVLINQVYYIDNDSSSRSSARVTLALQQMAEAFLNCRLQ